MAMKKAEMEAHRDAYERLMNQARAAQRSGLYRKAIELALSSWDHIDGMMQYERRYSEKEFASIEAIDLVLKYAPLLFDFPSLDALEALLKERKRIERDTTEDLGANLADARALMWDAHRMWEQIEQNPGFRQDELRRTLDGEQETWRSIAEAWEKMGLLGRTPESGSYCLALSTRLGEIVPAKCSACGAIGRGPKAMFLEDTTCAACGTRVPFTLMPSAVSPNSAK